MAANSKSDAPHKGGSAEGLSDNRPPAEGGHTGTPLDLPHYQPDQETKYDTDLAGTRSTNEALLKRIKQEEAGGKPEAGSGSATQPELRALGATNDRFARPYKGNDSATSLSGRLTEDFKRAKQTLWGSRKRKIATTSGILGTGGVTTAVILLSLASGPLEFVHIAQLLTHFHFGHISAASDIRLGKMIYQIATTGDTTIDYGDTRLGTFFNTPKAKNAILKDLADKGIKPEFGKLSTFKGFTIDTTNPNSKYAGMDRETALQAAQADLGDKVSISDGVRPGTSDVWDGKIHVTSGFFNDSTAIQGMVGLEGRSSFSTWMRARTLTRYTLASNFHPLRKLDAKLNEKILDLLSDWIAKRNASLEDGIQGGDMDTTGAKEETTDENGKPVIKDVPGGTSGPVAEEQLKTTLSGLKGAAGIAGGIAFVAGLICMLQTLYQHIGDLQYIQVIVPMTRMAMDAISVGNQIMSGQDVDMNEVAYLSKQFNTVDAKTHQVSSVWSDAAPIRAASGSSGGIDVNQGLKDAFLGPPSWLAWTASDPVNTLCSAAGQIIAGGVSIVVGIFSGEIISTIVGTIGSAFFAPKIIDWLSAFLAGQAVNILATGAEWGNDIDYGARLGANAEALQYGGVQLTNQQVAELDAQQRVQDMADFHSHSLAYQLFAADDYRSILGTTIDQLNITGPQSLVAKVADIPSIINSLFRLPLAIFTANVRAASVPYQYPFPEFGFSDEDMNNPLVQDPAANAKAVSQLLDNNNKNGEPDYIQKALSCFGVAVTNGSEGWDAVPTTATATYNTKTVNRTYGVNAYDPSQYSSTDCLDSGDSHWLQIRFWIFDTGVMEGYACFLGDDTSCTNDGFNGSTQIDDESLTVQS